MDTTQTTTAALLSEVTPTIRGLAVRLAQASGGSIDAQDLVQVGLMAALRCAQTFDPQNGASFRTYCWHPVAEEMKRARNVSRSVTGVVTRCAAKDVSFSAPANRRSGGDDETLFGDCIPDPSESAEELAMKAERDAKVKAIVARVRAEWKNKALFDDLLDRLMASHFSGEGERLRAEVPLAAIAEKYGVTRQAIDRTNQKIRETLTVALVGVEKA